VYDQPTLGYLILAGVYYVALALIAFLSFFTVYILVKYGKDRLLSLGAAVVYSAAFLALAQRSYALLIAIKNA
jgi:4-amino-4-deoxy-L-arabinose transferase-like glycosyltransferase